MTRASAHAQAAVPRLRPPAHDETFALVSAPAPVRDGLAALAAALALGTFAAAAGSLAFVTRDLVRAP